MEDNVFCDLDSLNKQSDVSGRRAGSGRALFFFAGIFVGLAVTLLCTGIVYLGYRLQDMQDERAERESREEPGIELEEGSAINEDLIAKLQLLETTIHEYFYLHDVTNEELEEGIYKGMLDALGDPYSVYYTPEELEELMKSSSGVYYGIGAYVSMDPDFNMPKISRVIPNSPAEDAGLRANDIFYEIDGESTYGLTLDEAVARIRGEEGTSVGLTIYREGATDYLDFTVVRARVESVTVEHEMLNDEMGYLQITEFDDVTVEQFSKAMESLRASGMKGLILDLRGNPGGLLDSVVDIAEMILPKGMIVYTEDNRGNHDEYKCNGKHELDIPLVVLVDMNSASASEILAGAIQDYGIGTLMGTTTFGKGIVQQIIPFRDGSAVKVTISSYYTPNGRNIHGIGIEPDVVVEFDGEAYYREENPVDNQLEAAKEYLKQLLR